MLTMQVAMKTWSSASHVQGPVKWHVTHMTGLAEIVCLERIPQFSMQLLQSICKIEVSNASDLDCLFLLEKLDWWAWWGFPDFGVISWNLRREGDV